jgi:hypothetical protein
MTAEMHRLLRVLAASLFGANSATLQRLETEINNLEQELLLARRTVINNTPAEFHQLLYGYDDRKFDAESDLWHWRNDVADKVSDAAELDEHGRAACPLCRSRGNSQSWGNDGWLPGGLQMHLHGKGRVEECSVVEIAFKMLRDNHRETFAATEQAKQDALAARLKTDPVLLIDPNREPVLTASTSFYEAPRPPDAWPAVEARLREMGFAIEKTGNVTAYKYMVGEDLMILADPRVASSVEFAVFKRSGKHRWKSITHGIRLQDRWKDWPEKFHTRLRERKVEV